MTDFDLESTKKFIYKYRWWMFAILVITYFFVYFHRMSVNAVGIEMIEDVGSGSKEYLSSIYFWTYAFMQIPSGILADKLGPRKATTIFLSLATVGSFLTCFADTFTVLAIGKIFIAAGLAVVYIPLMKLISVWYDKKDFPQLNGIVIAVGNVGALAAAGPLSMMADSMGWRNVFLVLAVITMILAFMCFAFIRDHPHNVGKPGLEEIREAETGIKSEDRSDAKVPVVAGLKTVAKSGRIFWTMGLAYFLIYGTIMAFQGTTSIAYFKSHIYTFAMAAWFVTMIGIGKIISTIIIGRLTSRGIIKSKKKVMVFGTFVYMLIWAVIWLFAGDINNEYFWFTICAAFGFFAGFMTLSFSQVKEWYPISISGTAVSAMNVLLFLGAAVATQISGYILHKVYILDNYVTLWMIMFVFSLVAFILVVLSKEKKESDPLIMPITGRMDKNANKKADGE